MVRASFCLNRFSFGALHALHSVIKNHWFLCKFSPWTFDDRFATAIVGNCTLLYYDLTPTAQQTKTLSRNFMPILRSFATQMTSVCLELLKIW